MKKILAIVMLLVGVTASAETLKVKSTCIQNGNSFYVHVPIKLQYKKLNVSYNKLLHLFCRDGLCLGMTMDTDINAKGLDFTNITIIENLSRSVSKQGYVVMEWGMNIVTVDFNSKKVNWNETGNTAESLGSGIASCN